MKENKDKKTNIGIFVDAFFPYIDGVVMVVENYAKNLDKLGKVYVICPQPKDKTYKYEKPYEVITCKSVRIPILKLDYPRPGKDKEFRKKLDEMNLDIIHIHTPFAMGKFALKLAKEKKIPAVATLHSQYKKDFKRFAKLGFIVRTLMKMIMKVFNGAAEVWTFNKGCRNTLYEYGYKGECHLVSNGTEMIPLPNISEHVEAVNKEYGLTDVEHVFIFVGRLYRQKNNTLNLKALSILKKKGLSNFKFVIVGEGEDKKNLTNLTQKFGLEENVIFTGLVRDRNKVAALFARSDLFLFPSLYDMSSLVQIEAACYNTPVLFLEGANTASAVTNEVNGFTSPNNVEIYADKIEKIISDKKKLEAIGKNAHKDLYITWTQLAQNVYDRYNEIIEQHKAKSELK